MIFIPIHITHRVKRKVDMRDSGILVDGVGGFVALGGAKRRADGVC